MELDKTLMEDMIRGIIQEELGKGAAPARQVDPSGIISVDPTTLTLEQFPFPVGSDRVRVQDAFSLEESRHMGCGILEIEDTAFQWTLQYDEIDYIIDGTLDIIVDGRTVSSRPGNILFIPKGATVTFSAKGKVRVMYAVHPANWFEETTGTMSIFNYVYRIKGTVLATRSNYT